HEPEGHLGGKQNQRGDKERVGDFLRLKFHSCLSPWLSRNRRWPALGVDLAGPAEEIDQRIELVITEVVVGGHLATPRHAQWLQADPGLDALTRCLGIIGAAVAQPDIAQLRREVGTLAEQTVAVDARLLLPYVLALLDGF